MGDLFASVVAIPILFVIVVVSTLVVVVATALSITLFIATKSMRRNPLAAATDYSLSLLHNGDVNDRVHLQDDFDDDATKYP